ncbi:hypothetical protein Tco_1319280 [Tanacetum coccineum]
MMRLLLPSSLILVTKEDFAFQINNRQLKKGRREIMPCPSKGKGLPGKKIADTPKETVNVFEESNSDPARKQTSSRRVIKKKITISTDVNIIPKPDVALELGKIISLTEAAEEEASRQVHATHALIVIESTPSLLKEDHQKLKGVQTLTLEEQLAADTMHALKESKKNSRRQPGTRGSTEGTGRIPGIPDESTESEYSKEDDNDEKIEWVDTNEEEERNDNGDDKSIDLENTEDEETNDEFMHSEEHVQDDEEETDDESVHSDEQVNDDEDEEMTNAEDADTGNGDEEITDTAKADVEKIEEVTDDIKKAELPLTNSSLSVSSRFGN